MQPTTTTSSVPEKLENLMALISRARGLCDKSCTAFATCAKLSEAGEATFEEGLRKNLHDTALTIQKAISLAQATAAEAESRSSGLNTHMQAVSHSLEGALHCGFAIGKSGSSIDSLRQEQTDKREINALYPIITSAFVARGLLRE